MDACVARASSQLSTAKCKSRGLGAAASSDQDMTDASPHVVTKRPRHKTMAEPEVTSVDSQSISASFPILRFVTYQRSEAM